MLTFEATSVADLADAAVHFVRAVEQMLVE